METQPLPGPLQRNDGRTQLPGRLRYIDVPPPEIIQEQSPNLLLEYWDILRRRKGALIVIAFLGVLAAVLLTLPQAPVYRARTSLEIQNLNENFLNMRDVNPNASNGASYAPGSDLETQVKILQSESVLEGVIASLNLEQKLFSQKNGSGRTAPGNSQGVPASHREEILSQLAKNLKVRTQSNTRIVEVLYESSDPKLAADIVNGIAAEFIRKNLEARWQTTQNTGEWLARQMNDFRVKLETSEEELQGYARATGLQFTSEKDNVAEEKLRQLQQELSKAQAERVARQSQYELAASTSPDALPDVLDNATLKEYHVKLTDLRRELAELSSSLTAAHPSVKKVQAQVSALESAIEKERANIIERIRNEFLAAKRRENLLAGDYAAHALLMSGQAAKVTHYNILKREVDTNRQLYDSMLQRVKEAGIASALRASNVRVVDPAKPAAAPSGPSLPLNSALGLFTGLFLGVVFVALREHSDRSIQAPGDAPLYLNVPELGVIPSASAERDRRFACYRDGKDATEKPKGGLPVQVELVTWQRKASVLAESFRATLASILYSGEEGDRPQVIVLTSANPSDGKTTVASNLALALAEIGRRVLLIDGDLRKPRLHEIFHLSNEWGLSDLLVGKKPPCGREAMVIGTGYRKLYLLPAGSAAASIWDVLDSERMPEFLNRMRREFDTVIIDTPPMLVMPDARVLGRLADGVILVVRSNKTVRDMALSASQRLLEDGTRILGTVLNEWNPRKTSRYGYRDGSRYSHDYRGA
jgi:polysaccharide biosynthesis transport protein